MDCIRLNRRSTCQRTRYRRSTAAASQRGRDKVVITSTQPATTKVVACTVRPCVWAARAGTPPRGCCRSRWQLGRTPPHAVARAVAIGTPAGPIPHRRATFAQLRHHMYVFRFGVKQFQEVAG